MAQMNEQMYADRESMLQVGVVTSPHGVHGEVKVFPTTDDNLRFKKLKTCFLDNGKVLTPVTVCGCKFFKNMVILKFQDINDMDAAQRLRQCKLLVTRDQAVKLETDEYFIADLIGCEVVTVDGRMLGCVQEVLTTNANDVYVVKKPDGKELLIPVIKQCVKKIDVNKKQITVLLLEGLDS